MVQSTPFCGAIKNPNENIKTELKPRNGKNIYMYCDTEGTFAQIEITNSLLSTYVSVLDNDIQNLKHRQWHLVL